MLDLPEKHYFICIFDLLYLFVLLLVVRLLSFLFESFPPKHSTYQIVLKQ